MRKYVKVIDARFHGGKADVDIEDSLVHIFSTAGYQTLEVEEAPVDLIKKIKRAMEENEDGGRR